MGLFDKFLEKKECGICGKELGLLGKTKLQDGYMCKDCARGLSPFFTRARESTVAQIEQQLAWREKNRERRREHAPLPTRTVEASHVRADRCSVGRPRHPKSRRQRQRCAFGWIDRAAIPTDSRERRFRVPKQLFPREQDQTQR